MKKYSYSLAIRKLIINQFGAALFGFLIFAAGTMLSVYIQSKNGENPMIDTTIDRIVMVIAIAFYMLLQYTAIWDIGAADRIQVDCGKLKYDKLCGLKSGILANIPNFILAFLCVFGAFMFLKTGNEFFSNLSGVSNNIVIVWESMYDAIIRSIKPTNNINLQQVLISLNYFTITIPSLCISTIGYIAGYNNKVKIGKK